MKKVIISLLIALGVVGGWAALQPHASAMGRFGDAKSNYIKSDEIVDGSAYLAGDSVRVEGTIKGDLYCAASKEIVITGRVDGDILCAGDSLTIGGTARNVRVAGQNVRLNGDYSGSVTVFGIYLDTESSAKIAGDLTGGAQTANLGGRIGRDVSLSAEKAAITSAIGRDLSGEYTELRIARDATINGSVHYKSGMDAVVDGKVQGGLTRTDLPESEKRIGSYVDSLLFGFVAMLGLVVVAVVLAVIAPRTLRTITAIKGREVLMASAVGLLTVFVAPILLIFIAITVVGIPLAFIMFMVWMALLALSWPVAAYYVGQKIFASRHTSTLLATFLGSAVLALACLVPYVGILATLVAVIYGVGMMVYALRLEYTKRKK